MSDETTGATRYIYERSGARWYVIDLVRCGGYSYDGEWIDGEIVEECRTRAEARAACRARKDADRKKAGR